MENNKLNKILTDIEENSEFKTYNNYIVKFLNDEIDTIRFNIIQDINRPNNLTDEELISNYILDNYGYKAYEIIDINCLEKISL